VYFFVFGINKATRPPTDKRSTIGIEIGLSKNSQNKRYIASLQFPCVPKKPPQDWPSERRSIPRNVIEKIYAIIFASKRMFL